MPSRIDRYGHLSGALRKRFSFWSCGLLSRSDMAQWCLPLALQQAGRFEFESAPKYGEPKGSSIVAHKAIAANRWTLFTLATPVTR